MHKTLQQREEEMMREQALNEEMSSSELEMKRLKAAQENAERHNKAKSATLNDLFAKYNI